ncbi:MAG TPA: glycosyltransferase [Chloroflexota bacterium]|nr:glycosyltransferase [Chloroflexota bacterium]
MGVALNTGRATEGGRVERPRLSVIVVPVGDTVENPRDTTELEGCLDALARQLQPPSLEVIVPYHAGLPGIAELRARYPEVIFLLVQELSLSSERGGSREHHDELRARGVREARGEIVAFLEDHVCPAPRWAARSVEAHQLPFAAVGGAVENGVDRPLNWATYFCDLGKYQNPVPNGESAFVSLVNASYKRAILDTIQPVWFTRFNETTVNAALVERGHKLALSSEIVVRQCRRNLRRVTAAREFFVWGRSYARTRGRLASPAKRASFAALAPLLPLILLARMTVRVLQKRRSARAFLQAFPLLVLLTGSWSWGETAGYWQETRGRRAHPSAPDREASTHSTDNREAPNLPPVSVVIAWVNSFELLVPGLDAIRPQIRPDQDEVIVVTRRGEDEITLFQQRYPSLALQVAPAGTPIPELRCRGLRQARGAVVAVTEDHCVPCDDWIRRIAHRFSHGDCDVVGGPVENASTLRLRDWAAFLTEYAALIKSARESPDDAPLPGNNVAYRRELVEDLCSALERGRWESFCYERWAEKGIRLAHDPALLVYHRRPFDFLYFVGQRFNFCRSFAAMRCQSLTTVRRLGYGVASAALPPVLLLRGFLALTRKRRLVGRYLQSLPLIALYFTVGAVGEMIGYLLGGGDSLARVD